MKKQKEFVLKSAYEAEDWEIDLYEENDISNQNPEIVKDFEDIFKKEHIKSDIKRFEMGYIDETKLSQK